jgi:hypothetical protein
MTALDVFLGELTTRGIRLSINGDRLRIKAPTGAVTPELRERLAAAKIELIAKLRAEAPAPEAPLEPHPSLDGMLSMPLAAFGRRHLALRVKLPDGSECWFVSGADEVAVLRGEGVDRGLIWTARELADVLGAGWARETIGRLIAVKREFGGVVEPVAPPPAETTNGGATT